MKKLIAANWKMNKTLLEALEFCSALKKKMPQGADIALFAPSVLLSEVCGALKETPVAIGAQNMHQEEKGAFTGEISASMIKSVGCTHVLLGHSERRTLFFEDDALINKKVHRALHSSLGVVLCVGETLKERESGAMEKVLTRQIEKGLEGVSEKGLAHITIAYEPVWAIGSGKVATPKQAQEAHAFIRGVLAKKFSTSAAKKVRILYGGSVTPENAAALFSEKEVNGALVGGASLEVEKFLALFEKK